MSIQERNLSENLVSTEYFGALVIGDGSPIVTELPRFSSVTSEITNVTTPVISQSSSQDSLLENLIIPLYGTIFFLSIVGNSLVLITLARNKRMRTVTNVYLLNLAVSDLLLGVFCMPFTLLGQILKNFVFGLTMCKLIPYFQAVSVSVGVWTLVAISLERYFAICRPLKSRRWQTQFHAYKMIAVVWTLSLTWNAPILIVSRLKDLRGGRRKCREEWPNVGTERAYNLFLDGTLLLIPLLLMSLAYSLIAIKLWRGLKLEIRQSSTCTRRLERTASNATVRGSTYNNNNDREARSTTFRACGPTSRSRRGFSSSSRHFQGAQGAPSRKKVRSPRTVVSRVLLTDKCHGTDLSQGSRIQIRANGSNCLTRDTKDLPNEDQQDSTCPFSRQHVIRSNYMGKSIEAKKKVIRMLFVIVLEFFVCWAPLHVINTWYLFAPDLVYSIVGSTGISLVQLLAYVSSCCNPITYCFMNRKFRQAFLGLFDCHRCWRVGCRHSDIAMAATGNAGQAGNNSELSGNDSTVYLGRASLVARSEVVRLLEEEDRV
ncbi:cholecystokinin receptor-like isoform X1 [Nylanderia fulva]|uniref:cholecystokinin receptor-like isoform X1 n=1 Tax=Nylanderia fulva TaxID=613905 RepID=UPI0010FAE85F|nr:cholecystokinin receptor-like isoform X1 [Nylanderia fulva]XP_029155608.1 cholecystokinin receptor-like isoform X1 [Nylanderia fulva]XP_029155609.1 cholecystokinin receptor-like isoform X1 [Nylanderia fulva]XP_029155610.1 cholecystokinin receptor-like isoform X1 [Nylanderia fulva]XP_029155611.1 cholecystokinin receptor-like isoform X1 [Nylanderia fulva]